MFFCHPAFRPVGKNHIEYNHAEGWVPGCDCAVPSFIVIYNIALVYPSLALRMRWFVFINVTGFV